jgi:hypothetical protein
MRIFPFYLRLMARHLWPTSLCNISRNYFVNGTIIWKHVFIRNVCLAIVHDTDLKMFSFQKEFGEILLLV